MGQHADDLINGDVDYITGEWIGNGVGIPRTRIQPRKSEDLSWKKVTGFMITHGFKHHTHPELLKGFGLNYSGKHPLRNSCFDALKDFDEFKKYILKQKEK